MEWKVACKKAKSKVQNHIKNRKHCHIPDLVERKVDKHFYIMYIYRLP